MHQNQIQLIPDKENWIKIKINCVSQCVLIPAVVAESMFEREGQKTAIEEGCLHNERGFPGSTQL